MSGYRWDVWLLMFNYRQYRFYELYSYSQPTELHNAYRDELVKIGKPVFPLDFKTRLDIGGQLAMNTDYRNSLWKAGTLMSNLLTDLYGPRSTASSINVKKKITETFDGMRTLGCINLPETLVNLALFEEKEKAKNY